MQETILRLRSLTAHKLLVLVLAVLAIGLIAAACGDDGDDDQAAADAAAADAAADAAAAEVIDATLKIGYLADFSGPLAEFGPVIQQGVELAIAHINAAGGVFGRPVELAIGDTGLDPTQGVEEARRLVEVEGVDAIVGPLSSTITIAVAESVTGPAGVPTISPSATSPAVTAANDSGYLFRSTISDAAQGVVLAQLATDLGFENVAVIFINDVYGQGLSTVFANNFAGTVTSASIEDGQASYLAELQKLAGDDVDTLLAISFPTQAEIYLREALESDLFETFLFVDGTKSEDLPAAIGAEFFEGFSGTAPGAGPETEAGAAWDAAFLAVHDELPTRPFVREAYDATIAIALAAAAANSDDGEAIRDALALVAAPAGATIIPGAESIAEGLALLAAGEAINYEGAATSLDWNADGDVVTGFVEIWQYIAGSPTTIEEVPFSLE